MPTVVIQLPPAFTATHEDIVIRYLLDQLQTQNDWRLVIEAFTILDSAVVEVAHQTVRFRTFYREFVDEQFSNEYLQALLALANVQQQSPSLWASYARQIVQSFLHLHWQASEPTQIRLCLSYLLYWWNAFARGYAFEAEIFQDLQQSGIQFQAHDLLVPIQRYSPSDLTVLGQAGDIKTSTYFLHVASPATHDFYIVRFVDRGRTYTSVVMLQPTAWRDINGDTVEGKLATILQQLPWPVRIHTSDYEFVVIGYDEWKRRILRLQGKG